MDEKPQNSSSFYQQGIQNCHESRFVQQEHKNISENKNSQNQHHSQFINLIKDQLNTANQILPAYRNFKDHKEKISFKLSSTSFYKQKYKLNQTAFPSINFSSQKNGLKKKQENLQQVDIKQQLGQFSSLLNDKKILIYQRLKNQKLNYLSKNDKLRQKISQSKIKTKYFCSLFLNPKLPKNHSKAHPIWEHFNLLYELENPKTCFDMLQFQSKFQSGNLFAVFRDTNQTFPTYQLFMQNDINTKGSTQWFYFKVTNKVRTKAKFRILNFYKPNSLYELGMKILVSNDGVQWKRVGTAITYSKNSTGKTSYCLQFVHQFDNSGKNIYFSYGYPYNYNQKLVPYLQIILKRNYNRKCINRSVLCRSNMANQVYILTITNNILFQKSQKPIVYVIGRQHPGQTPTSFVMEGFINFLLSNRIQAQNLRQSFQFRIIPMVNVDGVISGNYRTNISGNDVNRQWIFPSKNLHPEIYYIKQQIISNKRNVIFFLDIHAHSRKMNSFFYGSNQLNKANKFFPFVCSKLNKFISYPDSSFGDDNSKQSTGRVVIQKQLNLINSFTFQISFFGWLDFHKKTKHHFKISDLQEIGMTLALGLYYTQVSIKKTQQFSESQLSRKNQKQKVIYKNSVKIYEKWKNQLEKQMKDENEALSQGSSIDPEHFQLKKQQVLSVQNQNSILSQNLLKNHEHKKSIQKNCISSSLFLDSISQANNYQPIKVAKRNFSSTKHSVDIYKHHKISQNEQDNQAKKSNLFSYSSNEFFLMSPHDIVVRKLQVQLQNKNRSSAESRYLTIDQNLLKEKKRYLDLRSNSRYHDKVNEMKKVFNYCLNNNTDFESYKSNCKNLNSTVQGQISLGKGQFSSVKAQFSPIKGSLSSRLDNKQQAKQKQSNLYQIQQIQIKKQQSLNRYKQAKRKFNSTQKKSLPIELEKI